MHILIRLSLKGRKATGQQEGLGLYLAVRRLPKACVWSSDMPLNSLLLQPRASYKMLCRTRNVRRYIGNYNLRPSQLISWSIIVSYVVLCNVISYSISCICSTFP